MNLVITARGVDPVINARPTEWWQTVAAFTPIAVLLVLVPVLVVIALMARRQGRGAGLALRADWWNRAEWALEMALDDDPERRKVGLAVLDLLGTDPLAGEDDAQIAAHARVLLMRD